MVIFICSALPLALTHLIYTSDYWEYLYDHLHDVIIRQTIQMKGNKMTNQPSPMTPKQALSLLVQASQLAPMNIQSHVQCQQAAQLLEQVIAPVEVSSDEPKKTSRGRRGKAQPQEE